MGYKKRLVFSAEAKLVDSVTISASHRIAAIQVFSSCFWREFKRRLPSSFYSTA